MDTRPTRWRRATTASIVLHGSLMLLAWWWARPGAAVVHVRWFDEIARAMDPGYSPAELIPIELPEWTGAEVSTATTWLAEPRRTEAPRTSESPEHREDRDDSRSDADRPTPAPAPTSTGLLRGREDPEHPRTLGLAGGEHRAVDPDLLRGSAALYAASVPEAQAEGPRLPNEAQRAGDYSFVREGGKWIYRDPGGTFIATLQDDGGVAFRHQLVDVSVNAMPALDGDGEHFVMLKVEYDPVGVARLARGRDPSPRTKAKLLAATFEMRLEVATKYHKQRLIEQLNGIADELDAIWNRKGLSVAERKRLLFERWDECEEAGGELLGRDRPRGQFPGFQTADASVLDESRRAYAKAARQKIIRFIRSVAPKDGPDAFTEAELAQLNRQRVSTQAFAPYDP